MSNHTRITLLFFTIVILFAVFGIRWMIRTSESLQHDLEKVNLTFQDHIPTDYAEIIKSFGADSLKTAAITTTMSPVASFYSNEKALIMFKLPTINNKKIIDVIKCDFNTPVESDQGFWVFSDEHWVDDDRKAYSLEFSANPSRATPNIYLTLIGKGNRKIIKNDSTLIYISNLTDCSLSFQNYKDSLDMCLAPNRHLKQNLPVRLNFLKRNNFFYLIIQIAN